jgi:dTDP-4-dehydrorhamnose reductase
MNALITGMRGTVGSALAAHLEATGQRPTAWDRDACPPGTDARDVLAHIRDSGADAVFHLAVASQGTGIQNEGRLVAVDWTRRIAEACAQLEVPMVYTSTVMVWTDGAAGGGPLGVKAPPDATEGYGAEKLAGERATLDACPHAGVLRIGWQIGRFRGGNQMVETLHQWAERDAGVIKASRRWYPATSFLEDTAGALAALASGLADQSLASGVYHADANAVANPPMSFFEIVSALNSFLGAGWHVEADDAFIFDQRMIDGRIGITPLRARLE